MWRTVLNVLTLAVLAASAAGCGLAQTVTEGTAASTRAMFYKQVKTLHLDFSGRAALNTDPKDTGGFAVPTLVRVYQLRTRKALEQMSYDNLLTHGDRLLRNDLLSERTVVIKPGENAQLSMPLDREAEFVAVVALLRTPDTELNSWRLILARNDLNADNARVIALGDNRLSLRPEE